MRANRFFAFSFIFLALNFIATPVFAVREHDVKAVLWYKTSGEMTALYEQAYALARIRLDQILAAPVTGKPRALVFDIDETVLDNSVYLAEAALKNWSYPQGWNEWIKTEHAKAVPGAVEFCRFAVRQGIALFFITNRDAAQEQASFENLKKQGFPVKRENVIGRAPDTTTSKESRRQRRFTLLHDHRHLHA